MKQIKKKAKAIRLSAINKKVLSVYIREQKRVSEKRGKRYQFNYMR